MNMAKAAAALIEANIRHASGEPVKCVIADTCIGGCIRDPLSGRVFVHQAMRFTGGGDTLLYRVGPGGGDVSGDYNAYPDTWSVEAGGVSVTCKGADGTVSLALWERDGYSFSLSSEHGLSTVAVEAAAAGAQ